MKFYFLFALLAFCTKTSAAQLSNNTTIVSISFNETLQGYGSPGGNENDTIHNFQVAYEEGKNANDTMSFALQVNIADITKWLADPLHNAVCAGDVVEAGTTNGSSVAVGSEGSLHIFDGGVLPSHQLMMEYSLPFTSTSGNYTLYGVKHIPGNDCLNLLSQVTTLYVHVYDDDIETDSKEDKQIVRSGIVKIGAMGVISIVESLRIHGGTVADQIKGFLSFGLLLVGNILKNCLSISAYDTNFWYLWANDGITGVLLDLIQRPSELELRLAMYIGNKTNNETSSVTVHRQMLPLSDFIMGDDNVTVYFGKHMQMSKTGIVGMIGKIYILYILLNIIYWFYCFYTTHYRYMYCSTFSCTVYLTQISLISTLSLSDGININISFSLSARHNSFLPPGLNALGLDKILPKPVSQYGEIGNYPAGGLIGQHKLTAGSKMVKTIYTIPVGLDSVMLKWSMISTNTFIDVANGNNVDLQIEMVAMPLRLLQFLPPSTWIAPTYIHIDGNEHKISTLNDAIDMLKITSGGELTSDNSHRIFSAEIQLPAATSGAIHISLNCTAPASDFAMLDKEGTTFIHSTVRGSCYAEVIRLNEDGTVSTTSYKSERQNLLEIKA